MQRWKLTIEYDGTDFCGWQRQDNGLSVQGLIEESIFKFSGEKVTLHVAGRTDSGVHALGQVAHFDLEKEYPPHTVRNAINFYVRPHATAVVKAEAVSQDFHARFGATRRYYRYVICNRKAPVVIGPQYVWFIPQDLDIDKMRIAANMLLGEHDFTSFRALECQAKSPIKSIDYINLSREGDMIYLDVNARSFLHHQIRNIVGTLRRIGDGSWPPEYMQEILDARDRTVAGMTCPASGLFFMKVDYNDTGKI